MCRIRCTNGAGSVSTHQLQLHRSVWCCQAVVLEVKHEAGKVKVHVEGSGDHALLMSINHWKIAKFMTNTGPIAAVFAVFGAVCCIRHDGTGWPSTARWSSRRPS